MKTKTTLLLSFLVLLVACDSGTTTDASEASESAAAEAVEEAAPAAEAGEEAAPVEAEAAAEEHTGHEHAEGDEHDHAHEAGSGEAALPLVEVAAEGSRFDPAVEKAQVPAGNWICDMGTVHYAQPEVGDGTCPICNMQLVEHK